MGTAALGRGWEPWWGAGGPTCTLLMDGNRAGAAGDDASLRWEGSAKAWC